MGNAGPGLMARHRVKKVFPLEEMEVGYIPFKKL